VTLTAVAIPYGASCLVPVVPDPARYSVSVVIKMFALVVGPEINVIVVPIGKLTLEYVGIVTFAVELI
jgi:hypothetical protein